MSNPAVVIKRHFRELSVAAVLGVLLLVLAIVAPGFFARQQLLTTLTAAAPVLIAACGMTLVIVCRQIDISIGSQFALCSMIAGLLAKAGLPMPVVAQLQTTNGCWEVTYAAAIMNGPEVFKAK